MSDRALVDSAERERIRTSLDESLLVEAAGGQPRRPPGQLAGVLAHALVEIRHLGICFDEDGVTGRQSQSHGSAPCEGLDKHPFVQQLRYDRAELFSGPGLAPWVFEKRGR